MALFAPKCPVTERERTWIHESLSWFRGQFGDDPLRAPVVLPTSEYFPPPYEGNDDDVRALVGRVAGYMGVQADLTVRFSDDIAHVRNLQQSMLGGMSSSSGAAGRASGAQRAPAAAPRAASSPVSGCGTPSHGPGLIRAALPFEVQPLERQLQKKWFQRGPVLAPAALLHAAPPPAAHSIAFRS